MPEARPSYYNCEQLDQITKTQPKIKISDYSTKGQLNSGWIYDAIVSPKMPTKIFKDFCPRSA
jgi:hypothetical protein